MLKVTEAYFINPFEGHEKPLSDFRGGSLKVFKKLEEFLVYCIRESVLNHLIPKFLSLNPTDR